jgi:putative DNA methylase
VSATAYPKRLIEVDLPIKTISAEGAREKAIRRGNISTLHLWWARRPLAACRAVVLASLLPDPADPACPVSFRTEAKSHLDALRSRVGGPPRRLDNPSELRVALLDFLGSISNHERASDDVFLATARALLVSGHHALRPGSGDSPVVCDPFAGGGTIPFEALRLGADVFASDLNPVACVINRVLLEAAPRYRDRLPQLLATAAEDVRAGAADELAGFYPAASKGTIPIAYLWARWVTCEGPSCGARIPLTRSLWLMRRANRKAGLTLSYDRKTKRPDLDLVTHVPPGTSFPGTVKQGTVTCPLCSFSMKSDRIRSQLCARRGGTSDAMMLAIAETTRGEQGRSFRLPTSQDLAASERAQAALAQRVLAHKGPVTLLPEEPIPQERVWKNNPVRVHLYGMTTWADLFSPRQALTLATFCAHIHRVVEALGKQLGDIGLAEAVGACLALALDRQADHMNALCTWNPIEPKLQHLFGRQAFPFVWDFAEANPFGESVGDWMHCVESVLAALESTRFLSRPGVVQVCSATEHPLPNDAVDALITDPPYYDAVPYATLSDFFYVWLKRSLPPGYARDFLAELTPKDAECVVDEAKNKDAAFFERTMRVALTEGRRVTRVGGIGVIVFAHKTTAGWESLLQAILGAGWTVTASWPISTEMGTRLRARDSAALASSIHLVVRPREDESGGSVSSVGRWRDVIGELPARIHEWMPRLATEGVVGADAIFACLGPALEIFSRYSHVEKSSGDAVTLREYLEQVWAAVAREALSLIFEGADASGLEEDARLTAMWLWTLGAAPNGDRRALADGEQADVELADEDDGEPKLAASVGFVLEFDAARKIAQGLGAHLEKLADVVQVEGDKARLLSVAERAKSLFTKEAVGVADDTSQARGARKAKPSKKQLGLFAEIDAAEKQGLLGEAGVPKVGETTLDRVHQSMILFAASRSEALKRFVVEEGVGKDARFWKLAQSLSALYPAGSDEKRWVDGVLARKKSLGF